MKPAVIESMIKIGVGIHPVRIWRNEESTDFDPDQRRLALETELTAYFMRETNFNPNMVPHLVRDMKVGKIAELVMSMDPAINAVEVIQPNGNGIVIYRDWP